MQSHALLQIPSIKGNNFNARGKSDIFSAYARADQFESIQKKSTIYNSFKGTNLGLWSFCKDVLRNQKPKTDRTDSRRIAKRIKIGHTVI